MESPPRIASWSFSTHKQMRRCPARTKYAKIDRLPDPSGPAAERGERLHSALEGYIRGTSPYPMELLAWRPALDLRVDRYELGVTMIPELQIAMNANWQDASWDAATIRGKLDLVCIPDDHTVEVIDFKTGQRYEDDHSDQLQLYGCYVAHRYGWCERVQVANWYLDRPGDVMELTYSASDLRSIHLPKWRKSVVEDLSRTIFPAQRNAYCKYCPFSSRKSGPCTEG